MAQDSSCDEDKDVDLESPFPAANQVEVEETVVYLPPEQVRRVLNLRDYDPSADVDIDKLELQQLLIRKVLTPCHGQNKH